MVHSKAAITPCGVCCDVIRGVGMVMTPCQKPRLTENPPLILFNLTQSETMSAEKKRLLLFIVITLVFMGVWQMWYVNPRIEARKQWEQAQKLKAQESGQLTLENVLSGAAATSASEPVVQKPSAPAKRVNVVSDVLHGSFSLRGAKFDDLTMVEFKQTLDKESESEVLLSPSDTEHGYFTELGWLASKGVAVPDANTLWRTDAEQLTPQQPVTLTWDNGAGLVFERIIRLDEHYMFTVEESIRNESGQAVRLTPYGRINRVRPKTESLFISHEGPMAVIDQLLEEMPYDDIEDEGSLTFDSGKGWIGVGDKYWLTAIIPPVDADIHVKSSFYLKDNRKRFQIDYKSAPIEVDAGERVSITRHVFAGAKKVNVLNDYSQALNVPLFDRAIDYGMLYFLTKPLLSFLLVISAWLGNFGLAILVLTIIVKIILFPLASKSYRSFARMRLFMPEMQQIKERYQGDRMKMNEEMMAFYRKHRINPASGCLPILLQLPVFFALYKVLYVSIEMRHAPFYGWIQDLSMPDPTTLFNLFGLLPYDVAAWLPVIGAWPVLYAISMYVQQMLSPTPQDPTQAIVMKWLPVMFLFLFAGFPAGLVIYWVWNNVLSIAQQYYITRKINADPMYNRDTATK